MILGVVQGLTEFLPVSSSAHLLILPWLVGWDNALLESLFFGVALHLGTLLAVLVYFRSDILKLVGAARTILFDRRTNGPDERLLIYLIISSVPAAVAGFLWKDIIESTLRSPLVVVATLVIVAIFMFIAERFSKSARTDVTFRDAVIVGLFQAVALIPGVSRSGITISAGMFAGLDKVGAARYSFLMSVPVVAGACLLEFLDVGDPLDSGSLMIVVVGVAASFLSGLLTISMFLKFIRRYSFNVFVCYRIILAIVLYNVMG